MNRTIIATAALIYANGPAHLGHMVEYIQTDIWARFQRLRGNKCWYICGSDAHGTPIMINAQKQNLMPEQLIQQTSIEQQRDFADFLINFDSFYSTHSTENQSLVNEIYQRLLTKGDISTRTIKQAFDPEKQLFLPDRYIKGECPKCGAKDQYGDGCEVCGATYSTLDLKNPISVLSGATPIEKESVHYFFELAHYTEMLTEWIQSGSLQPQIANKLQEWLQSGLQAWDISRDAPYFGFLIPGTTDKYFYVWLDAPIGYLASLQHYCETHSQGDSQKLWQAEDTEIYHFIGKDIVYFHSLFWPAMLHGADLRKPTSIYAHGFLTVNGQKMSKSRGTFIKARTYLDHLDPEYLRYYFASKLSSAVEDIDLNFTDFMQRVNADLVGKVVNIASRCAGFIHKHFAGKLSLECSAPELLAQFTKAEALIAESYETREYARAVRQIMELADIANQYIDAQKPWVLIKEPGQETQVQNVCSMGLNLFKILTVYLKPILPQMANQIEEFLNIPELSWADLAKPLLAHTINPFKPLKMRITPEQISQLQEATQ
ncbi:MAG: metG [Gammaproteobacteria bacterium]|jgi:methionyl-tRNA synthetase|nr:metG [Gammaproteobacteria bacterium]